ncbi:DUF2726 domain-containing protein [Rubrobacter marinus]|uniref:DUF2726 domain-containing protein n=1 Tax=Rubrobacter marinus TaxID=2653852 RepID=A0A6G8PT51_9ACTN|nr:DUF2726 domain-containing protein [Rubrobacter marinus]QIN77503.1 DUF2726 domain-containing protein [Rubrobacter marinus]
MDRRKKILVNSNEAATEKELWKAATEHGARVFPKVRVADALNVQSSGLSDEEYGYALRAHFDFVVADKRSLPLFAVEFDGSHHENDSKTISRDELKRSLCDKLGLPLLRVDADYLRRGVGRFSLLGWFAEVWFMQEAFYAAQEDGSVPLDEPFFYSNILGFGYMDGGRLVAIDNLEPEEQVRLLMEHQGQMIVHRPYDPFLPYRAFIVRSYKKGACQRPVPDEVAVTEPRGYEVALAVLPVAPDRVIVGRSRVRSFMFPPVSSRELAVELSVVDAARKLKLYGEGKHRAYSSRHADLLRARVARSKKR